MDRADVRELHYITHLDNLASLTQRGILSHELAQKLPHVSVAMEEIQERRAAVRIPDGLRLHQYVNMYFNARNCMMFKILSSHRNLGVLSIRHRVLDLPNVVIADRNASVNGVAFGDVAHMLPSLDKEAVFREDWRHPQFYEYLRRKQAVCAEVLVERRLDPDMIRGVYVSNDATLEQAAAKFPNLRFKVDKYLFFQGRRA